MERHTKLRTDRWENTQAAQGISNSSIVTDAMRIKKETGDKENPYSVQAVPRWDTGLLCDKVMKSLGMYPEPSLRADPEQRPSGMKNRGVNKVRAAAHKYYKKMCASSKEKGYILWLLKMRSMTVDEMMGGEFESALAAMGPVWTEEGLVRIYDGQKRVLIEEVLAHLKQLNYLQCEAMIIIMG